MSYYGVFDGHSGSRASEFAAGNLHRVIVTIDNRVNEIHLLLLSMLLPNSQKAE